MLENKGEKSMLVYILKDLNGLRWAFKVLCKNLLWQIYFSSCLVFFLSSEVLELIFCVTELEQDKETFLPCFLQKKKRLNNVLYFSQRTANISTITGSLSGLYYLCCHQFWRRRLMQVSSSYLSHCFGRFIEQTASNWGQQKGCLVVFCLKVTLKIHLINKNLYFQFYVCMFLHILLNTSKICKNWKVLIPASWRNELLINVSDLYIRFCLCQINLLCSSAKTGFLIHRKRWQNTRKYQHQKQKTPIKFPRSHTIPGFIFTPNLWKDEDDNMRMYHSLKLNLSKKIKKLSLLCPFLYKCTT